ncbi:hypothetical protein BaRGS_00014034 [Batillaria attramentaria]|uniref:Uncharacterized protein n=1 Tax=Batillaria attramentaria TaxID=370345 RepID=A0ABD0L513_9CAEN
MDRQFINLYRTRNVCFFGCENSHQSLAFAVSVTDAILVSHSRVPVDRQTLGDWQLLYLVMGVIHLAGVLAFDLGVSAERQPWAHSPDNRVTLHPPQSDGVRKRVVREGGEGGSEKEAETVLDDHVERETMPLLK